MHSNRVKRYCPYCGVPLTNRESDGRMRLYCEQEQRFIYENPIPAVTGIVADEAGRILVIRRNREPGRNGWALPGGFIEMKESPLDAARREIEEECGIAVRDPSLVDITYEESKFFGTSILIIAYSFGGFEGTLRPGDDAADVRFCGLDELPRMAFESHDRMIARFLEKRDERRRLWSEGI
jgi:8-oxo-dGTP diphosphatase